MSLTISGAPANLTVGYTPTPSDHGDGTFDIPIAALVADINGNPVVDGTQVYFGVDRDAGVILSPIATQQGRATTRFTYPESAAGDTVQIQCQSGGIRAVGNSLRHPRGRRGLDGGRRARDGHA